MSARAPSKRPGPPGGRRRENRRRRHEALTAAGLALFLEKGIEGTTIDAIVGRGGMSKGSFYRYFSDKEALVAAVMAPVATRFDAAAERCRVALADARSPEALAAAYGRLAADLTPLLVTHADVLRLYLQESRGAGVGARLPVTRLADTIAERAIALTRLVHGHALFRPIPPEVAALAVVGAAERLLASALAGELPGDPVAVSEALISLVLDGVRAR